MNNNYQTSDIAISAYLMMKELRLQDARRSPSGKFEFVFLDPDDKAFNHALEFVNSEFCKFDNHLRSLKKILYKS